MTNETEWRLRTAFERLKTGAPDRTKPSGRITVSKITSEAGYDKSYIHGKSLTSLKKALKEEIQSFYKQQTEADNEEYIDESKQKIRNLREKRDNEEKLKKKYRNQLNENASVLEAALTLNMIMAHHIVELEMRERNRNESNVTRLK